MIPSLLQIPSAVSDSKLHSVLPNNGKGDFTFDRSTGATRINKDGLIEEVGYFSSELVQNGNFSELGSDVVLNGNFDNGSTSWTLIGDVSIGNGVCTFFDTGSNTNSRLVQVGITANKTYKVVFSVTRYVAGRVQLIFGGASAVNVDISAGVGTYTAYVTAGGSTQWEIKRDGTFPNFDFDIDNVSVKQVDPNDRWEAVGNSTLNFADFQGKSQVAKINITDTSTGSRIRQPFNYVSGTKYKISVEVYLVSGNFRVDTSNSFVNIDFVTTSTTGSWITLEATYDAISTGSHYIWLRSSNTVSEFYVSNISVVEVQGDRPRLSYDITNGVVEKQPHLLLEPSSTNLVTFSEDFSQWNTFNLTAETNTAINPKGTSGCYRIFVDNTTNSNLFLSTASIGTSYTISIYAKSNNANKDNFQLRIGDSRSSVFTATSEWQRFTYSATATGSNTFAVAIFTSSGTVSSDILIFGAQVETTAYATSYIPTAGTTITRAAETCNNSKPSVNSTEGVLYAEIAALANDSTNRYITLTDGTNDNRIILRFSTANKLRIDIVVTTNQFNTETDINANQFYKAAFSYKQNHFKFYIDGVLIASATSGSVPSAGTFNVVSFESPTGGEDFYGKVKGLAVYNEALTDAQLIELTS